MYEVSEELKEIAERVMDKRKDVMHLKDLEVRLIFLKCNKEIRRVKNVTYADTEKVKDKYKSIMNADFIITFYTAVTDDLSEEQMETLMWHELKHVGYDGDRCWIIPHDTQDFRTILIECGVDWAKV